MRTNNETDTERRQALSTHKQQVMQHVVSGLLNKQIAGYSSTATCTWSGSMLCGAGDGYMPMPPDGQR